jgi:tRNA (Thr-GGU) A37 N-methylase
MCAQFAFTPIGVIRSTITEAADDVWGGVKSRIDLAQSRFGPDCLAGLEEFSHVEVVFLFDRVQESTVHLGARHPRGRADWPTVGIFAQRAKDRPNRIGVTVCRLLAVDGFSIVVEALDGSTVRLFSTSSPACGSSRPADSSGSPNGLPI